MSRTLRMLLIAAATTLAGGLLIVGLAWRFGNDALRVFEDPAPSRSVGSRADGHLVRGKRLPSQGRNFVTYSYLGSTVGRTSVHDRVRDTLIDAWSELEQTRPDTVWMYGETAWPSGGDFWPHRTHQHGLSVDLMVPVTGSDGRPSRLPCRAWNALCYTLHADDEGRFPGGLHTDFDALAMLIDAVYRHARTHGLRVRLVIYAPDLQDELRASPAGRRLGGRVALSSRPSWVRHDNHIHVDFAVVR